MLRHLMTLARLVVHALPCALVLPFLLLSLIVALNPGIHPPAGGIASAWLRLVLAYGLPVLVGFPLSVGAVRFFAAHPLRIGWIHLKSTVWFLVAGVGAATLLYGWNLVLSGDLLAAGADRGLRIALAAVGLCWIAGTTLATVAQIRGRQAGRGARRLALVLLLASAPASMTGWSPERPARVGAPLAVAGTEPRAGAVVTLAFDGASLSGILPLVAEGRLPALARLMREGAYAPLETLHPCRTTVAWASLSTGRYPRDHGIRDLRVYRLAGLSVDLHQLPMGIFLRRWLGGGWLTSRLVRSDDLRCRATWEILDRMHVPATFLRWPLAGPPETPAGPSHAAEVRSVAEGWRRRILEGADQDSEGVPGGGLREALMADASVREDLLRLIGPGATSRPRLLAARFPGLAAVLSSIRWKGPSPPAKDSSASGGPRRSTIVSGYYEIVDGIVGEVRAALMPGDYLMIVSPYGVEPLPARSRLARWLAGLPATQAGEDGGAAGIFFLSGPGVAQARPLDDVQITDTLPLVLYLLGLPVGRDMNGSLPRRLFSRAFLEANPIAFIPSYG